MSKAKIHPGIRAAGRIARGMAGKAKRSPAQVRAWAKEFPLDETRTPYDGKPYYCRLCGCGLEEFIACEEPDCALESERKAKKRKDAAAKERRMVIK